MTAEVLGDNAIIDGDFRPLDDLPHEDRPEEPLIEQDDRPNNEEQRLREEISTLLLQAHASGQSALARGIHGTTRQKHRATAGELTAQADILIADLIVRAGGDPEDTALISGTRKHIRDEALAKKAEQERAVTAAEIGRSATRAIETETVMDGWMRAAEGSLRSPWNQD